MASSSWKKVIVSGSSAQLDNLTTSNNVNIGGTLQVALVDQNNFV